MKNLTLLSADIDLSQDPNAPLIYDDKIVFGILLGILALIFWTSAKKEKGWQTFYKIIPALFLCYFIPSILATAGIISADYSDLYTVAKYFALPAALILMTIAIDIPAILRLGPKALIMFFTGTVGIILGGPLAMWIMKFFSPETVGGEGAMASWKGFATLAGSWIGGGANQTAMLEVYGYDQSAYGGMVTVDIVVANVLMAALLIGIGYRKRIDKWLKADNTAIDQLVEKVKTFEKSVSKRPTTTDYMKILGVAFIGVALAHWLGDMFSTYFTEKYVIWNTTPENPNPNPEEFIFASKFFWLVLLSTFIGFGYSFTSGKKLEGVGASKFGSIFIYFLVATIGMKMDITKVLDKPLLIVVGLIWIVFHIGLMLLVAKLIKAPYFFVAVGSQANVGGAASAPVVAEAFHPALTTVGVLLAVLGYFVGTIGAILCAELMHLVAP